MPEEMFAISGTFFVFCDKVKILSYNSIKQQSDVLF